MRDINNSQDILDSRDVIARRDELAEERAALVEAQSEGVEDIHDNDAETRAAALKAIHDAGEALREWDADNAEELAALEAFISEGSDEWSHGVTLVRESYFEDYAQELAEEVCDIDFRKLSWPLTCIDWKQAARELRYDYTGADWAGVTYYYR